MIIYKVKNLITQKVYVGKTTKTLNERKNKHLKNSKNGIISKFYNSIRKYDKDNFLWETIKDCAVSLDIKKETLRYRIINNMPINNDIYIFKKITKLVD